MEAGSTSYDEPRSTPAPRERNRRYRLTHHLGPVAILAGLAFIAGVVVGALYVPAERDTANRFARAWASGNYDAMYRELSDAARARTSAQSFREAYAQAAATATATRIAVGNAKDPRNGVVDIPVKVSTRVFGTVVGTLRVPFSGDGKDARIDWRPDLTFPGVARGAHLARTTRLPPRATLLARNGRALAKGNDRSTNLTAVAAEVVGQLGPIAPEDRLFLRARGYPDDAQVGISGLERALQPRLAGRPGGTLSAGGRILARTSPSPAAPVTTTIDPRVEEATISALGGQSGGVAVLVPTTGEILALAGTAFSATGPPGSTFKVITTTAALEDHKVKLKDDFPVRTAAILSGVSLANANGESCGGTFEQSFAHSCNSVFAPLGVKVGKDRLVQEAQAYGWNEPPAFPGAMASSIPPASGIGDDLDIGSTAIGQGKVLASPLQMASVAATVGNRGVRVVPTLERGRRSRRVKVTTPAISATLRKLMIGVVKYGTGTSADIPGVQVAGKTGTAELGLGPNQTDAWFIAFAPARRPRVALAVWRLRAGAGGQFAAPIARQVLASALGR